MTNKRIKGTLHERVGTYSRIGTDRVDVIEQIRLLIQDFNQSECEYVKLKCLGRTEGNPTHSEDFRVYLCGKSKYKMLQKKKPYTVTISWTILE